MILVADDDLYMDDEDLPPPPSQHHGLPSQGSSQVIRWEYIDPQGEVQGPFANDEMDQWYKAGFFPPDLLLRCINQPASSFRPLSDISEGNPFEHFLSPPPPNLQPINGIENGNRDDDPSVTSSTSSHNDAPEVITELISSSSSSLDDKIPHPNEEKDFSVAVDNALSGSVEQESKKSSEGKSQQQQQQQQQSVGGGGGVSGERSNPTNSGATSASGRRRRRRGKNAPSTTENVASPPNPPPASSGSGDQETPKKEKDVLPPPPSEGSSSAVVVDNGNRGGVGTVESMMATPSSSMIPSNQVVAEKESFILSDILSNLGGGKVSESPAAVSLEKQPSPLLGADQPALDEYLSSSSKSGGPGGGSSSGPQHDPWAPGGSPWANPPPSERNLASHLVGLSGGSAAAAASLPSSSSLSPSTLQSQQQQQQQQPQQPPLPQQPQQGPMVGGPHHQQPQPRVVQQPQQPQQPQQQQGGQGGQGDTLAQQLNQCRGMMRQIQDQAIHAQRSVYAATDMGGSTLSSLYVCESPKSVFSAFTTILLNGSDV